MGTACTNARHTGDHWDILPVHVPDIEYVVVWIVERLLRVFGRHRQAILATRRADRLAVHNYGLMPETRFPEERRSVEDLRDQIFSARPTEEALAQEHLALRVTTMGVPGPPSLAKGIALGNKGVIETTL